MNRRPKFLIVLVFAIGTYIGLMKTIGPEHFNHGYCQKIEHCENEKAIRAKTYSVEKPVTTNKKNP
jgi:hypothetical protein